MSDLAAASQPDLKPSRQLPWSFALPLVAIVLCGAGLRGLQMNEELWLDELHTSWVVAETTAEIPARAHAGNQSPLYFYLVWCVVQLCGHSPWALRLISLVSGVALMAAVAWLVRRWSDSMSSGLLAATLLALSRDCIFFAQEARPYALVQLSAVCHALVFVAMLTRPTRLNRLLFVIGAAWLFYLHYTTFLLFIAQAVCLTLLRLARSADVKYRFSQAIVDALLIAVMLLPATAHLLVIAQRRDNWARIVQPWPPPFGLELAMVLYAFVPLAAVGLGYCCRRQRHTFSLGSVPGVWAACWFLVPVVTAWLTTLSRVAALCMVRYLVASVAGAIVYAALCHSVFRSRGYRWLLGSVLVAGTALGSGFVQQMSRDGRVIGDRQEAWGAAAAWLNDQLQHSPQPVFLCAGLLEDLSLAPHADQPLVEYCLFPVSGIHRLQVDHLEPLPTTTTVTLTPSQQQLVRQSRGMWLIVRAGPKTTSGIATRLCRDLQREVPGAIILQRNGFGTVTVLQLGVE